MQILLPTNGRTDERTNKAILGVGLASSVSVLSVVLSWYQLSQCHLELTDIKTLCLKYDTMAVTCNTKLLAKKLKPDFELSKA